MGSTDVEGLLLGVPVERLKPLEEEATQIRPLPAASWHLLETSRGNSMKSSSAAVQICNMSWKITAVSENWKGTVLRSQFPCGGVIGTDRSALLLV